MIVGKPAPWIHFIYHALSTMTFIAVWCIDQLTWACEHFTLFHRKIKWSEVEYFGLSLDFYTITTGLLYSCVCYTSYKWHQEQIGMWVIYRFAVVVTHFSRMQIKLIIPVKNILQRMFKKYDCAGMCFYPIWICSALFLFWSLWKSKETAQMHKSMPCI